VALTRRQIIANVGGKLGIVRTGTATSLTGTTAILDVSDDSPLDPGDQAERFSGAGLLVVAGANLGYRQNVTYVPATQSITFASVTGLAGTPYYEIHLEPLLHRLLDWPVLIDEGLALIRRISLENIYLTGRGYYDLSDWTDIIGPEQIRRLYDVGPNLLQNADFFAWPSGASGPDQWTVSAALDRAVVKNYSSGALLNTAENMYQEVSRGFSSARVKVAVWAKMSAGTGTLEITTRLASGSAERTVTATTTSTVGALVTAEIETTNLTAKVRVTFSSSGGNMTVWAPMAYIMSQGQRRRVRPFTTLLADSAMKLFVPSGNAACGELALLLPYAGLGATATDAADAVTTAAPDKLIEAAVAVQVLAFLTEHPQVPASSKSEYAAALKLWSEKFQQRTRLHMRRIAKTQSVWESGELN